METNSKATKRKFKYTKELVKLAINEGWTQKEIADKCRVQQSVVSAWLKGEKQGTEQQLQPLLDIFGHKLRRNAFKVYWSIDAEGQKKFYKVEGKVIFSQTFFEERQESYSKPIKKIPKYKITVHYQGKDLFCIIPQRRIIFKNFDRQEKYLESHNENAIWNSYPPREIESVNTLIKEIEELSNARLKEFPHESFPITYLIREALLNHGFSVHDVQEYPALW